jgi:hypothetical protein
MPPDFSSLMDSETNGPDDWMKITPDDVVIHRSSTAELIADPTTVEDPSDDLQQKAEKLFEEQDKYLGNNLTLTSVRVWTSHLEMTIKEQTDFPVAEFIQWYFSKLYGNSIKLRDFSVIQSEKRNKFRSNVSFKNSEDVNFKKYKHNFITRFTETTTTLSVKLPLTLKNTLQKRPQNIKDKLSTPATSTEIYVSKFVCKSDKDSVPNSRIELEITKKTTDSRQTY